jgi:hypothetical protein
MELLLRHLGAQVDEVSFAVVGDEIRATSGEGYGDSTTRKYESKSTPLRCCGATHTRMTHANRSR